jgi:hypothetical protein
MNRLMPACILVSQPLKVSPSSTNAHTQLCCNHSHIHVNVGTEDGLNDTMSYPRMVHKHNVLSIEVVIIRMSTYSGGGPS